MAEANDERMEVVAKSKSDIMKAKSQAKQYRRCVSKLHRKVCTTS